MVEQTSIAVAIGALALAAAMAIALVVTIRRLVATRALAEEVIASIPGGYVLWDADDRLVSCSDTFRECYPRLADMFVPGATFSDILRVGIQRELFPQAAGREDAALREFVALHQSGDNTIERLLPDGRWVLISERKTRSGGILATRFDITPFKLAIAEAMDAHDVARHMAHHDALTGLPNRMLFQQKLQAALRSNPSEHAVLYIDLDRFKVVNDSFGHPAGDELLAQVAKRLRAELRDDDVAARLGGDEFGILIRSPDAAATAARLATRLIEKLAKPFSLTAGVAYIGASVGGASLADCGTIEDIVQRADQALYAAKRAGRGTYVENSLDRVETEAA